MSKQILLSVVVLALCASRVLAQFDSGSDGSDGAFNPQANIQIDLSLAATATWDTPSPVPGQGVYDPDQWAVVFKYTTIDIPAGVTVTFSNNPSGAPVVWLATDPVTIAGAVNLNAQAPYSQGAIPFYAEPGPGGFRGAIAQSVGAGGFGPGGGGYAAGGSYQTPGRNNSAGSVYGNVQILPLIGGSGGAAGSGATARGPGAGGGAILIASGTAGNTTSSRITLVSGGWITCNGNGTYAHYPWGSGGAIRLIAETVEGAGRLQALGGPSCNPCGGDGRIRIEATDSMYFGANSDPFCSIATSPSPVFAPADAPTLRVTHIDAVSAPADPLAGIVTQDVEIQNGRPVEIEIEATNIPDGTTVKVRVVPVRGGVITATSTPLTDDGTGTLTAIATVTFPAGRSEIQLRANW